MADMKEALEVMFTVLVAAVILYLTYRFWKGLFTSHKSDTQSLFPKDRT
jgi:hypothetical protein